MDCQQSIKEGWEGVRLPKSSFGPFPGTRIKKSPAAFLWFLTQVPLGQLRLTNEVMFLLIFKPQDSEPLPHLFSFLQGFSPLGNLRQLRGHLCPRVNRDDAHLQEGKPGLRALLLLPPPWPLDVTSGRSVGLQRGGLGTNVGAGGAGSQLPEWWNTMIPEAPDHVLMYRECVQEAGCGWERSATWLSYIPGLVALREYLMLTSCWKKRSLEYPFSLLSGLQQAIPLIKENHFMCSSCCQSVQSSPWLPEKGEVDRQTWVVVLASPLLLVGLRGTAQPPPTLYQRENKTGHIFLQLFDFVSKIRFLVSYLQPASWMNNP